MRSASSLFLVVLAVFPLCVRAADPSQVDATKRNARLAPTPESADTPLSPTRETNQRTFFRNDYLQDQRFRVPDLIDRKHALVGDRRAPIEVTETREKVMIDRKGFPTPEIREREINRHDGEMAFIQPEGEMVNEYEMVSKFQDRMRDADLAAAFRKPKFEKTTSFEKLNRFMFKRNGPGTEGNPVVTPAAGGPAPASQDTYTKYHVDWTMMGSSGQQPQQPQQPRQ